MNDVFRVFDSETIKEIEKSKRRKAVLLWILQHGVETLALIVAIIALIRTF